MTTRQGLSEAEAARLRASGDGNNVTTHAGRSYAAILRQSAAAPVNIVLIAVCAVLLVLGLPLDAAVTAVPVLLNIGVSAGLEARAKYRLDRLRILSAPRATVIRDGAERSTDPAELVRGDLLVIARGDQIVLDGEVVDGEVEVDESLLSGESDPVVRRAGDELRSGTVCLSGRGTMRVTRVGAESYANRLTADAQSGHTERTPLQRDVDRLIAMTAGLVGFVSVVVALGARDGAPGTTAVAQAAAVLVALVPQGLAIMVTVTDAAAALRISRAGALVQRINAVESMSRVDTLILDKTGTITTPTFELREIERFGADDATIRTLLRRVVGPLPEGDRIAGAIRRWIARPAASAASAASKGERVTDAADPAIVEAAPFSSARRWSGVLLDGPEREAIILGAPEALLDSPVDPELAAVIERWTGSGLRVLVLARATDATLHDATGEPRLPNGSSAVALLAFAEEIRPDATATLGALAAAGLTLKVVSGDGPRTVAAIAARAGLPDATREPVAGTDLTGLDDAALADRVEASTVIGRVEPQLKARIVAALRGRGRYLAMTGDGVNDILALKTAQLGIAMESGSSATRAVADIVLLGDRFAVLPTAIQEGRRIVDAMLSASSLLLTRTLYMLLIVLGATIAGLAFPFTPRGNSLLALVTVGLPSVALMAWAQPVASPPSLLRAALRFAIPAAIAVAAVALPVYAAYLAQGGSVALARSALVTITVDCGTLLIPFLVATTAPGAAGGAAGGRLRWRPAILAVALFAIYDVVLALPTARWLFDLEPIPVADAVRLAVVAVVWSVALRVLRDRLPRRGLEAIDRVTAEAAGAAGASR